MASDNYVDFAALKAVVSIKDILERYDLTDQLQPKGSQLVGPCPLCESQHETAFQADTERDCWYCFAEGEGGSVLDFVARREEVGLRTGDLQIAEWFETDSGAKGDRSPDPPMPADRETATAAPNEPLDFELQNLAPEHPRVQKLGIRPRKVAYFDAGFCTVGLMEGRLAIPIHNRAGELVAYTGRATGGEESAYLYPDGFDRTQEVFNSTAWPVPVYRSSTACIWRLSRPAYCGFGRPVSRTRFRIWERAFRPGKSSFWMMPCPTAGG